jgi:hypothetical protein
MADSQAFAPGSEAATHGIDYRSFTPSSPGLVPPNLDLRLRRNVSGTPTRETHCWSGSRFPGKAASLSPSISHAPRGRGRARLAGGGTSNG